MEMFKNKKSKLTSKTMKRRKINNNKDQDHKIRHLIIHNKTKTFLLKINLTILLNLITKINQLLSNIIQKITVIVVLKVKDKIIKQINKIMFYIIEIIVVHKMVTINNKIIILIKIRIIPQIIIKTDHHQQDIPMLVINNLNNNHKLRVIKLTNIIMLAIRNKDLRFMLDRIKINELELNKCFYFVV